MLWIFLLTSLAVYLLLSFEDRRDQESVEQRLQRLVAQRKAMANFVTANLAEAPTEEPKVKRLSLRERMVAVVERLTTGRRYSMALEVRLLRADWKLRPAEFFMFQVLSGVGGLAVSVVVARNVWWLFLAMGLYLPVFLLGRSEKTRLKMFDQQLPDALSMIANALRSGYSFLQAMDTVSREMPHPISREFGQVLRENRVNIPLDDALTHLTQRVRSADLDLVVTAVLIQRQVGGNLSEVLDKIGDTIKNRIRMVGEVKALTAQGRFSGWIVCCLPPGLGLLLNTINPGFLDPLFKTTAGLAVLGVGVVMQAIGITIIVNMVNMEV